jgi:putative oxidoreductase
VFSKLLKTKDDLKLTLIRVVAGGVMLPHGMQKLLGWNGGAGFTRTMQNLSKGVGIPTWLVFLVIVAESFGALGMILGLFSRIAAFSVFADMIGAALLVNIHSGFFMNWAGTRKGEGIEYHLLMMAMSLAVMIWGGGAFSVDRALSRDKYASPAARRD